MNIVLCYFLYSKVYNKHDNLCMLCILTSTNIKRKLHWVVVGVCVYRGGGGGLSPESPFPLMPYYTRPVLVITILINKEVDAFCVSLLHRRNLL